MTIDEVYQRAAEVTGKTVPQMEAMARDTFASMLHHAMREPGRLVWIIAKIDDTGEVAGKLYVEVNVPPGETRR
ncbi:MAG: hypothetical protein WBD40_08845 [Tepidisphaeraceae bacterium]